MQSYLQKIIDTAPGWNTEMLGEDVFFALCKKHKIRVEFLPLRVRGFYHRHKGKSHIAISSRLGETETRFVMFHEFGHYLMHATGADAIERFCGRELNTRDEQEADTFAYCALLPLEMLKNLWPEELAYEWGYGSSFLMERLKVYERYGI